MPISVEDPLYGGNFSTSAGIALPFVLPGETLASVISEPPEGLSAPDRLAAPDRLSASPARVTPRCSHFGACGGCNYQHADYATQLALKRTILSGLLTGAGLAFPEIETHAAAPYEYRNRIRLRAQFDDAAGALRLGYSLRGSHHFLPIHMCPIAAPVLWRAAQAIAEAASQPAFALWLSALSEVELFTTQDETRVQAVFLLADSVHARAQPATFAQLCSHMQQVIAAFTGASAMLDPELNRRVRRQWAGASWGAEGLAYSAGGRSYWVPRGAFFQVNRWLIDSLIGLVTTGRSGALAWDLFAGVGLFTRPLAETFRRVVAVEGAETAAADLARAGRAKGLPAFEAVHTSTLEFLRRHRTQRDRPDLIVLDPPRAGLGTEGAAILAEIGAPEIVYVSCEPTTLARDLAVLTRTTYSMAAIHFIDLFPQTFHIETVTHLIRRQ